MLIEDSVVPDLLGENKGPIVTTPEAALTKLITSILENPGQIDWVIKNQKLFSITSSSTAKGWGWIYQKKFFLGKKICEKNKIRDLGISSDGKTLVTVDASFTLRRFDLTTNQFSQINKEFASCRNIVMSPISNTIFVKQSNVDEWMKLELNKNELIKCYNLKGTD